VRGVIREEASGCGDPEQAQRMKGPRPTCKILLDLRTPWLVEFTRALASVTSVIAYSPQISLLGGLSGRPVSTVLEPGLNVIRFPVRRGYFSRLGQFFFGQDRQILRWLKEVPESSGNDCVPLICCLPHYVRIAGAWAGPVVYYVTDLFRHYAGWNYRHIGRLERLMCQRADLMCPNSRRIAEVLVADGGANPERIVVVPNGVGRESLLAAPATAPAALPADVQQLRRPVAGVIGNLAGNMDWVMIEQAVRATPWLSWLFVGPYSMRVRDPEQRRGRAELLKQSGSRVVFVGSRPVCDLKHYARALDVAVLPYRKAEPTYSGSSTRFYEHLAATRPIIASDGFAELLSKPPLLRIAGRWEELVQALEELRERQFRDGYEELRWVASQSETWEGRARTMLEAAGRVTGDDQVRKAIG